MIETLSALPSLRARVADWRRGGLRIGFVPTMGNLHAGHHSLVGLARGHVDRVVASVFVNPTQFAPGEDYARYPRTPEADAEGLAMAGCDLLWLPSPQTMYPLGSENAVQVHVPGVTEILEGVHRPGHFDGVCTVVARLLNQVQPDVAVFGRKDYQQLAVVRHMVADLAFPVDLVAGETVRDHDGLALSSRNQYLTEGERSIAPELHRTLQAMVEAWLAGRDLHVVEAEARVRLERAGFGVDYVVIRTTGLQPPGQSRGGTHVALAAASLGSTRLIDNLEFASHG